MTVYSDSPSDVPRAALLCKPRHPDVVDLDGAKDGTAAIPNVEALSKASPALCRSAAAIRTQVGNPSVSFRLALRA
jgi:hypothetical protein